MELLLFLFAALFLYQRSCDCGLNPWWVLGPTTAGWLGMMAFFGRHPEPAFVYMGVALRWGWVLTICWMVWAAYFDEHDLGTVETIDREPLTPALRLHDTRLHETR